MNDSWLKKNIIEILAITAVGQFLVVLLSMLFIVTVADNSTRLMILTTSGNFALIVITFYFGSSKGSKDKQLKLDEISYNNQIK